MSTPRSVTEARSALSRVLSSLAYPVQGPLTFDGRAHERASPARALEMELEGLSASDWLSAEQEERLSAIERVAAGV